MGRHLHLNSFPSPWQTLGGNRAAAASLSRLNWNEVESAQLSFRESEGPLSVDAQGGAVRRVLSKAAQRDLAMRVEIRRIAEIESTVRYLADFGPVGEADIAAEFDSMIEADRFLKAGRFLDTMVVEKQLSAENRKSPTWLEQQLEEQLKQQQSEIPRPSDSDAVHWQPLVAAQWMSDGGATEPVSPAALRPRRWYDPEYMKNCVKLRRLAESGEIVGRRPGRGDVAKEEWLGYRDRSGRWYDPMLDPEVVFEAKHIRNRCSGACNAEHQALAPTDASTLVQGAEKEFDDIDIAAGRRTPLSAELKRQMAEILVQKSALVAHEKIVFRRGGVVGTGEFRRGIGSGRDAIIKAVMNEHPGMAGQPAWREVFVETLGGVPSGPWTKAFRHEFSQRVDSKRREFGLEIAA